jgi:predicted RNA-binding protein with PUA-like domain
VAAKKKKASARAAGHRASKAPAAQEKGSWKLPAVSARGSGDRRYWLLKTEPESFSFDDLLRAPRRTTSWDGVRNYQARNYLRDNFGLGDLVFIYHSSSEEPSIVGIAEVVREAYPDTTAFDPKHEHFDPKSDPATPAWLMVDVRAVRALTPPIPLATLRSVPALAGMVLLQPGSRLSVQPVSEAEWNTILALRP